MVSSMLAFSMSLLSTVGIGSSFGVTLCSNTIWFLSTPMETFGPRGFCVESLLLVLFSVNVAVSLGVQTLDSVIVREFLLSCFSIFIWYFMHVSSGPVALFVTGTFPIIEED